MCDGRLPVYCADLTRFLVLGLSSRVPGSGTKAHPYFSVLLWEGFMLKSARHVLLSLAAFVVASPVVAQSPQSRIGDPAIEAVTSQLRDLTHLAADEWRYHAGDLPHGADAGLDDSRWTVVKSRSQAPESTVWYRRWIVVPPTLNGYDLTGTKLCVTVSGYANGQLPEVVYFSGRRVAMGEDLQPIILLYPGKTGDRVLIAVKLLL